MARSMRAEDTDFFRLEKHSKYGGVYYEGPYTTLGVTRARMAWNKDCTLLVIQQLGISHGELVWVDVEAHRKES